MVNVTRKTTWTSWIDWMLLNVPCSVSRTWHRPTRIIMNYTTNPPCSQRDVRLMLRIVCSAEPRAGRSWPDIHEHKPWLTTLTLTRHVTVFVWTKQLSHFSKWTLLNLIFDGVDRSCLRVACNVISDTGVTDIIPGPTSQSSFYEFVFANKETQYIWLKVCECDVFLCVWVSKVLQLCIHHWIYTTTRKIRISWKSEFL